MTNIFYPYKPPANLKILFIRHFQALSIYHFVVCTPVALAQTLTEIFNLFSSIQNSRDYYHAGGEGFYKIILRYLKRINNSRLLHLHKFDQKLIGYVENTACIVAKEWKDT